MSHINFTQSGKEENKMDADTLKKINGEIYRRFPEVKGKKPKKQQLKKSAAKAEDQTKTYLLVYSSQVSAGAQQRLPRLVRVVATENGEILKITTSK